MCLTRCVLSRVRAPLQTERLDMKKEVEANVMSIGGAIGDAFGQLTKGSPVKEIEPNGHARI